MAFSCSILDMGGTGEISELLESLTNMSEKLLTSQNCNIKRKISAVSTTIIADKSFIELNNSKSGLRRIFDHIKIGPCLHCFAPSNFLLHLCRVVSLQGSKLRGGQTFSSNSSTFTDMSVVSSQSFWAVSKNDTDLKMTSGNFKTC